MRRSATLTALFISSVALSACGTVKEKSAPCKRPANLTSYAENSGADCPTMMSVNDPNAAFAAVGIIE